MYVLTIFDLGLEQIFGQDVLDRNCSMLCKYSNGQEHHFKSSERNGNYLEEDQSCRLHVSYDAPHFRNSGCRKWGCCCTADGLLWMESINASKYVSSTKKFLQSMAIKLQGTADQPPSQPPPQFVSNAQPGQHDQQSASKVVYINNFSGTLNLYIAI